MTPSSVILRSLARLNTWKPPLSVRIGPSQRVNLCSPPISATSLSPGAEVEVVGVAEHDLGADLLEVLGGQPAFDSAGGRHVLERGVCTVPWTVQNSPRRAACSCFRSRNVVNEAM